MTEDVTLTGAGMLPRLVVRVGGRVIQEIGLRAELSIGRAEDNDLRLADPKASRHHARLHRQGTAFLLTDLGSANGTLLNGVRLTAPRPLQHGDRIVIGDTELIFQEPGRSSEETMISPAPIPVARPAPVIPPPPVPALAPRRTGGSRGLTIALVLMAAALLGALVLAALYLLVPNLFGPKQPLAQTTPTTPLTVASPTLSAGPATTVEPTATLSEAPTAEPGPALPANMDDLLAQAALLTRRSRFEEAIALYQDLVRQAPGDARPEVGWTWALILDNQPDQAVAHGQKAVQLDPTGAEAATALARAYLESGDTAQAVTLAETAVNLNSGSSQANAVLAEAYMASGNLQQAVDKADLALVQDVNNAEAHRIRAWLYYRVDNDLGRAASELQIAAGLQPELWLRRHELGRLLLEAEDYVTALMAFQDALNIRPKAVTYAAIGETYYRMGQFDQAKASLQQALSAGAADPDTYALLAATYAHLGRCDEARSYYDQVLAQAADNPLALEARDLCQAVPPSPAPSATTEAASPSPPTSTPRPTVAPTSRPTAPPAPLSGRIAFPVWNPETGTYDTYIARADGSGRHRVVEGMHQPALSPNGEWLLVNGEKRDYMNMYLVKPDGSGLKKITNFIEDAQPCWSPDGTGFVLATTRDQPDHPQRIYVIDEVPFVGKMEPGRLLNTPSGPVQGEYPTWTPDNQIVYKGCDYTVLPQDCGLFLISVHGGPFKQLTHNPNDTAPAAYGGRIAFTSNRDGNWEIYLMNYDGTGLKRLTHNAADDGLPVWSPDGKTIAFVSNQGGPWAIWAMNSDGSSRRKLFDIGGGGLVADWLRERISWGP